MSASVAAQTTDPAIAKGVTWLQSQVQSNGSLANEINSVATPFQARAESLGALALSGNAPSALITVVGTDTSTDADDLARDGWALIIAGQSTIAESTALINSPNSDGGWGLTPAYSSDPVDTALSLRFFCALEPTPSASVANQGIAFLQSDEQTGGGFSLGEIADPYITAQVLSGLADCAQPNRNTVAAPAAAFLEGQRNTNGDFGDIQLNALALKGLSSVTADSAILNPIASALDQSQQSDGSWAEDPYLTALAVEALMAVKQVPPSATTGGVTGKVTDLSGNPIVGATVQLVQATRFAITTASDGTFTLSGISPGTYTVSAQAEGFTSLQVSAVVTAGSVLDLGVLTLASTNLTATLTGHIQDSSGGVVSGAIVDVGPSYVATDTSGNYTLSGLPVGPVTITVTDPSSYQTVSAAVTFAAGQTYVFSPTLYSSTPATTSLTGKIVDAQSKTAISGAQISLGAQTVASQSDGTFTLTGLSPGAFSLSVTASQYETESVSGILGAGVNNVGNVPMTLAPTSSTVTGIVTDYTKGTPIAGATVSIATTTLTATSDVNGHYEIDNVSGSAFTVVAAANGYLTQQIPVQLTGATALTLNIPLVSASSPSAISFTSIQTSSPSYPPNGALGVEVAIANAGSTASDLRVEADILDSSGSVVAVILANPVGLVGNVQNQPIAIPAGSTTNLELQHVFQSQPAGSYRVHVVGYSTTNTVLADGYTTFAVDAETLIGGAVTANPPLVQAGTDTPVHITGLISNIGNETIASSNAKVTVTLDSVDPNYNPPWQGNLTIWASDPDLIFSQGAAADPAGNLYTVSQTTGSQTKQQLVKLTPSGQIAVVFDLTPYLVNAGNPRAIARDTLGNFYIATGNYNAASEVTAQGSYVPITLPSQGTSSNLVESVAVDSSANQYFITSDSNSGGSIFERSSQGNVETLFKNGGLSYPQCILADTDGSLVVGNTSGALSRVATNGSITSFGPSLPQQATALALGSDGYYYAGTSGEILKVARDGSSSVFAAISNLNPSAEAFDSHGNLFIADASDNAIMEVKPDGTSSVVAKDYLRNATSMSYGAGNSLFVKTNYGVSYIDANNNASTLATGISGSGGIAADNTGGAYVANGEIDYVRPQSAIQFFANPASNPAQHLGQANGLAFDGTHNFVVATVDGYSSGIFASLDALVWYDISGNQLGSLANPLDEPTGMAFDAAGNLFIANRYNVAEISNGVISLPGGDNDIRPQAVAYNPQSLRMDFNSNGTICEISSTGSCTQIAYSAGGTGLAVDDQGHPVVMAPNGGSSLLRANSVGTFTTTAAFSGTEIPTALASSLTGVVYVATNQSKIYQVADSGALTLVATWTSNSTNGISSIGVGPTGLIAAINGSGTYEIIDPATGQMVSPPRTAAGNSVIVLSTGNSVYLASPANSRIAQYDGSGNLVSTIAGFVSPTAIVWTGTDFRFTDAAGDLFSWTPGAYPTYLGNFGVTSIAWANGSLFGVGGALNSGVFKWTGSGASAWVTQANFYASTIAARADGDLGTVDLNGTWTVFDVNANIVQQYYGVRTPRGLAIDGQDHVFVSSGQAVLRIDRPNSIPETIAKLPPNNGASALAFDRGGSLLVTSQDNLYRMDSSGTLTLLASEPTGLQGPLAVSATGIYALGVNSNILQFAGDQFSLFASGLSGNVTSAQITADGSLYMADNGTGNILRFKDGVLSIAAATVPTQSMTMAGDGTIYAGGNNGAFLQISPDGSRTDLGIPTLLGSSTVYGLASLGPSKLGLITTAFSNSSQTGLAYTLEIPPKPIAPAAGTVVYQAVQPLAQLQPGASPVSANFGSWTPSAPGDYRVDMTDDTAPGVSVNYVHVGSSATATLTTTTPTVAPGNATVPLTLQVTGADYESLSVPDVSHMRGIGLANGAGAGVAADAAGNLYYSGSNGLYMLSATGTSTEVVPGYTISQVAIDPQGRVIFAGQVVSTNAYVLVRYDPAGSTVVLYQGGTVSIDAMDVDSLGDAYFATGGNLVKVNPDGTSSVVTNAGVAGAHGLSFDGQGDLFIETSSGITVLHTDDTPHTLYASADGVTTPAFEDEGNGRSVVGDCGSNLYAAPISWTKLGISGSSVGTEEHDLVQIDPDTGNVGLIFDGYAFGLTDIDTLSYDRFQNRLLIFNDSTGSVTALPILCGAISVEAHVVSAVNQPLSNFTFPPAAQIALAGGLTDYVFSLQNVPTSGFAVHFNAALSNLALGSNTPVVDHAYLLFKNSYTGKGVQVPVAVPSVTTTNAIQLSVATDQLQYAVNTTAQVSAQLNNPSGQPAVSGQLSLDVLDSTGALVAQVTSQNVSLGVAGSATVQGPFSIGTILPGTYTARATWQVAGQLMAQSTSTFTVTADIGSKEITSTVAANQISYNPNDTVTLISHVTDASQNATLDNLTVALAVNDPTGHIIYTQQYSLAQILPQQTLLFQPEFTLQNAVAGTYAVQQQVKDFGGNILDTEAATFQVSSSAQNGAGLAGSIAATPKPVASGQPVQIAATVTNSGNAAITNVPIEISIIDPPTQTLLQRWVEFVSLAKAQTLSLSENWIAQGRQGATYVVALTADVGSGAQAQRVPLASGTIALAVQTGPGLTATGGTPQSGGINQPYPVPLTAKLLDSNSQPIAGTTINFTVPTSGASVTFPNGATATTDQNGNVSIVVVANALAGSFAVTANSTAASNTATFTLDNLVAQTLTLTATGGAGQTANANAMFAQSLQATVTDSQNQPVAGVPVTFTSPTNGASVSFPNGEVVETDQNGNASIQVQANAAEGSYVVTATAPNASTPAMFALTNLLKHVDLRILLDQQSSALAQNQIQYYHVHVDNLGPDSPASATISIQMPPQIIWWQAGPGAEDCVAGGAQITCPVTSLPSGTSMDLCFAGRAQNVGPMIVSTQAQSSVDAESIDPNLGNDTATVTTQIVPDLLYANGFESEECIFSTDVIFRDGFE